jgi:hypothetical protein
MAKVNAKSETIQMEDEMYYKYYSMIDSISNILIIFEFRLTYKREKAKRFGDKQKAM